MLSVPGRVFLVSPFDGDSKNQNHRLLVASPESLAVDQAELLEAFEHG